jgi:hypothetical protein
MMYQISHIDLFEQHQSAIHQWMLDNVPNYNALAWAVIENCRVNEQQVAIPLPVNGECYAMLIDALVWLQPQELPIEFINQNTEEL